MVPLKLGARELREYTTGRLGHFSGGEGAMGHPLGRPGATAAYGRSLPRSS